MNCFLKVLVFVVFKPKLKFPYFMQGKKLFENLSLSAEKNNFLQNHTECSVGYIFFSLIMTSERISTPCKIPNY